MARSPTKNPKVGTLVLVLAHDHFVPHQDSAWVKPAEVNVDGITLSIVGWVVRYTKDYMVLAQCAEEGGTTEVVGNLWAVPLSTIKKIHKLLR